MADPKAIANAIAGYFSDGEKAKAAPAPETCPTCGQTKAPPEGETLGQRINYPGSEK